MRGTRPVEFSAHIWKTSSRTSQLIGFLPRQARDGNAKSKYKRKPARCQRATVSGATTSRAFFQPVQSHQVKSQKNLSDAPSFGLGFFDLKTAR
jgi:hypothetical protein